MSKHKLISILGCLSAVVVGGMSSPAFAYSNSTAHVAEVLIYSDGHATVRFTEFTGNVSCPSGTSFFSLGTATDAKQKNMVQVAMSALLSGRAVSVSTTAGNCQGNQEKIDVLSIK